MSKRRTHSVIDKLPADLRETLTRMIVDNEWPDDFPKEKMVGFGDKEKDLQGNPRYIDCVVYCKFKGHTVSESAVGRFGMRMRVLSRMKQSGLIVRDIMKDLTDENALKTQKAVAEVITAQLIETASEDNLTSKELMNLARAVKDCTAVAFKGEVYRQEQIEKKLKTADKEITKVASKKNIDPETLRIIREQIYGIIK